MVPGEAMQNMGAYLLPGTILLLAFLMTLPFISSGLATGVNPLVLFLPNEIDMLAVSSCPFCGNFIWKYMEILQLREVDNIRVY